MSSSSKKLLNSGDSRLSSSNKGQTLNPNAAEFIPSAFRYPSVQNKNPDSDKTDPSRISIEKVEHWSVKSVLNQPDDEAHQYWQSQLPDDITPDFNSLGKDDFMLSGLSIDDGINAHNILGKQLEMSPRDSGKNRSQEIDYASTSLLHLRSNNLENRRMSDSWNIGNLKDKGQYSGNPNDLSIGHVASDNMILEHFEILSLRFPDYALESLAEVYYANGSDLNSTIEMLNQLELKVDAGFNLRRSSKAVSSPALNDLDLHLLQGNGNGLFPKKNEGFSLFKSSSFSDNPLGSRDFIPSSHKIQSKDHEPWKYEDGLSDSAKMGPIRSLQVLGSPYNVHGKALLGDKLGGYGKVPADYAMDMREEAQNYARVRSDFYKQWEKEVYPMTRKVLGKELGTKGLLHNVQVKDTQEKSREVMQHQRGQNPLIDLHGLHVNEAIHVLKHELNILKRTAKSAGRRLQVIVCVGVESSAQGLRPPTRLPAVVQQYLLHENLHFSEDQPGLLRVVIC